MPDFLSPPVNDKQLDLLIEFSNYLMDKIMEEEENSKLEAFLHLVGSYISDYEEANIGEPIGSPIEALEYLCVIWGRVIPGGNSGDTILS